MTIKSLFTALLLITPVTSAFAGAQLYFDALAGDSTTAASRTATTSIFVQNGNVRIEDIAEQRMYSLYDSATKMLTVVDRSKKTYMVVDSKTLANIQGQIEQAKQMVKLLPPQQRQKFEAMLGFSLDTQPELRLRETADQREVAGIKCFDKELLINDTLKHVFCVADRSALALDPQDYQAIAALLTNMQEMAQSTGIGGAMIPLNPEALGGLPVRLKNIDTPARQVQELNRIERKTLAAEMFQVPAGYKRQNLSYSKVESIAGTAEGTGQ